MKRFEEIFIYFSVYLFVCFIGMSIIFLTHFFTTGVMVAVLYDKLVFGLMVASSIFTITHFTIYGFEK